MKVVPCHQRCNNDYKLDEEYLYHSLYPAVADVNPTMGQMIFEDFKRKCSSPQTPALIQSITKTISKVTPGGIHLPTGKVAVSLDEIRLQRIAIKIARGVLWLEGIEYISETNCVDIHFGQADVEVPERYQLSWQATAQPTGDFPNVFSYRYLNFDEFHLVTLLFWESVMFCLCFGLRNIFSVNSLFV